MVYALLSFLATDGCRAFDKENIVLHIFHGWESVHLKPFVGKNSFTVKNTGVSCPCDDFNCFQSCLIFFAHFLLHDFLFRSVALLAFQPLFPSEYKDQTFDFVKSPETPPRA